MSHPTSPRNAERAAFVEKLRALGTAVNLPMIGGTTELYKPLHAGAAAADVKIVRDERYGEADRHRLDLFVPAGARDLPVLVFVHGGGFVSGDKSMPGSPFYDNVGLWAARNGFIGVTMTYRLAPDHRWPSGSDDVSQALGHLRRTIAAHGGDASKLFVMGQSAGAVHVAGYIANEQAPSRDGWSPAGAILVSGLFDTHTMDKNPLFEAYFGTDPVQYADRPFLVNLARTEVPLMVVLAELDPPDFLRQSVALLDAYLRQHNRLPHFVYMLGHNHLSTVLHLNTTEETLAVPLLAFTDSILAPAA